MQAITSLSSNTAAWFRAVVILCLAFAFLVSAGCHFGDNEPAPRLSDKTAPGQVDNGGSETDPDPGEIQTPNDESNHQIVGDIEVFFSPLPLKESHVGKVASLIENATTSVDIAIYSYGSTSISSAIAKAIAKGVEVRVIYEKGNKDNKLEGKKLKESTSGRFEELGADVRFVNRINHHKFIIVDGPRDDAAAAEDAIVLSGSANFRKSAAEVFDETTLVIANSPETAVAYQKEFDRLWRHSRDFVFLDFPFVQSSADLEAALIEDDPDLDVRMTSQNFVVSQGSTTFKVVQSSMVAADLWVEAVEQAQSQILISSGHFRLRPLAEALIAKREEFPDMDIRVYLDQQEYISFTGNKKQLEKRVACVFAAELIKNDGKREKALFKCLQKSFLWARELADADIDVRFKTYALRWSHAYAPQMHNKWMVIDGERVLTGSYNLSINAEHGSFENVMDFSAPTYSALATVFANKFERLWSTGEGGLEALQKRITTEDPVPLVFADSPIALTKDEVSDLRKLIRANCPQADDELFRKFPEKNQTCPRLQN